MTPRATWGDVHSGGSSTRWVVYSSASLVFSGWFVVDSWWRDLLLLEALLTIYFLPPTYLLPPYLYLLLLEERELRVQDGRHRHLGATRPVVSTRK